MKAGFKRDVYTSNGGMLSDSFYIGNFEAGKYVGLALCYEKGVWGDSDRPNKFTPYVPFRILAVKKEAFSFKMLGTYSEVLLETSDHQTGNLTCTYSKDRLRDYTTCSWTLDDNLVSWIENDLHFTAKSETLSMKIFSSTSEVQKAMQEVEKIKKDKTIENRDSQLKRQEYLKKARMENSVPVWQDGPTQSELDDLFYGNKLKQQTETPVSNNNDSVTVTCGFCGWEIKLPARSGTITYYCPNCGYKGEYTNN